jgi:hypothetical protein
MIKKLVSAILISISIVGMIGIPMGDPRFFTNAIILESIFVLLAAISFWRFHYIVIPNMIIAVIVIVGNTVSPKHIEIMTTLTPPENGIVLILGGYVLQGLLLGFSLIAVKKRKQLSKESK